MGFFEFMPLIMINGTIGVQIVKILRILGNFDFILILVYVLMLGFVGTILFTEGLQALKKSTRASLREEKQNLAPKFSNLFQRLPFQMNFPRLGIRTSPVFPILAGMIIGLLSAIMGVGGGFIMVPMMIYIIGMPTVMAIGTDLFQMVFVFTFQT